MYAVTASGLAMVLVGVLAAATPPSALGTIGTPAERSTTRSPLIRNTNDRSLGQVGGPPCGDNCTDPCSNGVCQRNLDFGDAPDPPFPTRLVSGLSTGARHELIGPTLGAIRDGELDGQPSTGADGDGNDEDGVLVPEIMIRCSTAKFTVTLPLGGRLRGWIDWDGFFAWSDPSERMISIPDTVLASGIHTFHEPVPCSARRDDSVYVRFRVHATLPTTPGGYFNNGEVEDYVTRIADVDFGDAPEQTDPNDPTSTTDYHTSLAENGAHHAGGVDIILGVGIDREIDGQPSVHADGDDNTDSDDEDGIELALPGLRGCETAKFAIRDTTFLGGGQAFLNGWLDINRDGDWSDVQDKIVSDKLVQWHVADEAQLNLDCDVPAGRTYGRFRLTKNEGVQSFGFVNDGEVEDYPYELVPRSTFGCTEPGADNPVVMVHGFSLSQGVSCEDHFGRLKSDYTSWGWPTIDMVQWYGADSNCDGDIHDFPTFDPDRHNKAGGNPSNHTPDGGHNRKTPVRHLAWHLAWYLSETYSSQGVTVDAVGYSAGGMLLRYAIAASEKKRDAPGKEKENWPTDLKVEDVFTAGSPHGGGGIQVAACAKIGSEQCDDFKRDSTLMNYLMDRVPGGPNSRNPQGMGGTQWTAAGSTGDIWISSATAIGMDATHRVEYNHLQRKQHGFGPHKIIHETDPQPPAEPPDPEVAYYFADSGCGHHEVTWINECRIRDPVYEGYRCFQNYDRLGGGAAGHLKNMCLWIFQPHVNYHSSLALVRTDW